MAYIAGFDQPIEFSVSGVPAGSTAKVYFPVVQGADIMNVVILTDATSPGSYPLTITGVSGPLTHTAKVTFIVPAAGAPAR